MSNFLDANVPQMASSAAGVQDAASMFRTTLHQAESTAAQAQAFHQGESSAASPLLQGSQPAASVAFKGIRSGAWR